MFILIKDYIINCFALLKTMKKVLFSLLIIFLSIISFPIFGQTILDAQDYLKFIENKGQWNDDFLFKSTIPNGNLFLKKNQLIYNFVDGQKYGQLIKDLHDHTTDSTESDSIRLHAFSVDFLNANPSPTVFGENAFTEKRNYFLGETQASNVQAFQKIIYKQLLNQIDLHIFQSGNSLKYEFHLAPHANPHNIELEYNGVNNLSIENEELHIKTSLNEIIEEKPYAYQIIDGVKKEVHCKFVVKNNILSYKLGHYKRNYPLIIDPKLIFSTYSGSTSDNWGNTACLDQSGNLYTGGTVFNAVTNGFPTTIGAFQKVFQGGDTDIGILKFDSSGTNLLYATYIGGNDSEIPTSLIANDNQELYILATTSSPNFPTSTNAFQKDFKGALSLGKWFVNGQLVATNTNTFSSNNLKQGDTIQQVFNHSFCKQNANQIDSSNKIIIDFVNDFNVTLTGSKHNFCNGDSIFFTVNHPSFSTKASYEWFINDLSIGNDTSIFFSKTLKNGDIIQAKVTNTDCNLSQLSNKWEITDVSGQKIKTSIISAPKIVCSEGLYSLSIDEKEVGFNPNVVWKNKNNIISNNVGFRLLTKVNDTIYAQIESNLTCLSDTTIFSDTLIINNSTLVNPVITLLPSSIESCESTLSLTIETEYIGFGSTINWFYENTLLQSTTTNTFSVPNPKEGKYKVEITNNTLGCVSSKKITDSINVKKESFVKIEQEITSLCENQQITFSSNVADFFYNQSNSVKPVDFYSFNNGSDICVIKLSATGNEVLASTFIGGRGNDGILFKDDKLLNHNYGDVLRGDINIDKDGNVYIASVSQSSDFPTHNAAQNTYGGGNSDGVSFKLNADFSQLLWSTYVGGNADDALYSIQKDSLNNVYVTGGSLSDDYPITNNAIQKQRKGNVDAVITKIDKSGKQFLHSTYLGTDKYDQAYFVQLDNEEDVYILGQSKGQIPILPDSSIFHQKNAGLFVTKFNNDLTNIIYSTTLGDTISTDEIIPNISPTAFLVNECENLFIAGWGGSTNNEGFTRDLPITKNAFQTTTDGSDFYLMAIQKDLNQLLYATYFGGPITAEHVDGGTSRFDEKGIVYQSVCAGCLFGNNDFPIYPPLDNDPNTYPMPNKSENCNNGVIKFDLALLKADFKVKPICDNKIEIQNLSIGGLDFQWKFGDTNDTITLTNDKFIHQYDSAGSYLIELIARDITTCTAFDTSLSVIVIPNQIGKSTEKIICIGNSDILTATQKENATYSWNPTTFLQDSTKVSNIISPTKNINYTVSIIDSIGCEQVDTFFVKVKELLIADFKVKSICDNKIEIENLSIEASSFNWDFGDGKKQTTNDKNNIVYQYQTAGQYSVSLFIENPLTCTIADTNIKVVFVPNQIGNKTQDSICVEETLILNATQKENATYSWLPNRTIENPKNASITISPLKSTLYLASIIDTNNCEQVDTFFVKVKNYKAKINTQLLGSCKEFPIVLFTDSTSILLEHEWDFGNGVTSQEAKPSYQYKEYGDYLIKVNVTDGQCVTTDSLLLPLRKLYVPNIVTPNNDGKNDNLIISGIENNGDWNLEIYNRWGKEVFRHEYYDNSWTGDYLEDGTYYYLLTAPDETTCKGWIEIIR